MRLDREILFGIIRRGVWKTSGLGIALHPEHSLDDHQHETASSTECVFAAAEHSNSELAELYSYDGGIVGMEL
jgi:hypothetical protein